MSGGDAPLPQHEQGAEDADRTGQEAENCRLRLDLEGAGADGVETVGIGP